MAQLPTLSSSPRPRVPVGSCRIVPSSVGQVVRRIPTYSQFVTCAQVSITNCYVMHTNNDLLVVQAAHWLYFVDVLDWGDVNVTVASAHRPEDPKPPWFIIIWRQL
jgi:hypothetical protein